MAVAQALRQWLPDVIQSIEPWMSLEDIDAGARWGSDIAAELSATRFGIICLTGENQTAPWILFEAGALAKTIESTFVVPYLIGLDPSDIYRGPLIQFQAKRANLVETRELIRTINRRLEKPLPDSQIERTFQMWWPKLNEILNNLPPLENSKQEKRSSEDMMEEILELVRHMRRSQENLLIRRVVNISPREERIIKMLYGLEPERKLTHGEIADFFGLSRTRIRQIEFQTLEKLYNAPKWLLERMFGKIDSINKNEFWTIVGVEDNEEIS
jgi:hypothetical protein